MMKDIPLFTTENGAASLTLKEIPFRGIAYVTIQASLDPEALLEECLGFCKACDATAVYAAGADLPERYLVWASVLKMRGIPMLQEALVANIFPVTEDSVKRWRDIYNEKMQSVFQAATLTAYDDQRILKTGGAYFIHSCGELLGIGWLAEGKLMAIASVVPGAGRVVAHTLLSVCPGESVELEVASNNHRAIALYESLGLLQVEKLSNWAKIF